jgi:phage tail sheath protein FI
MRLRRVDVSGTIHSQLSPFSTNGDKDRRPEVIEQWNNLSLDPDNPNFIARAIGDKYQSVDAYGKVTIKGDYANLSRHIWVEVPEDIKDKGISADLVPFGYAAIKDPISTTTNGVTNCPSSSIIGQTNIKVSNRTQILDNVYNKNVYYGFNYIDADNHNYLKPIPSEDASAGANVAFNLSNEKQHPSASLNATGTNETTITPGGSTINLSTKKFIVPFQGGFDGFNPSRFVALDTNISAANMQGFDLSTAEKDGSKAYKRAINAVANPDEYDINLMVTPGPNHRLHSVVTTHAKNTCEERGDAFYVMDAANYGDSIATVTNTVKAFDTNYAATYYPWVKILDTDINKPVWVPPSVVVPGAIAYNDQVSFEWFAPAGLNRGSLTEVIETADRVTHEERDDLYEGRVNPIATFPGQGVCIWGQKTLQGKPSALDRVNVRRLLIAVKKFIASATRYLVFENNTSATRNRFLNIVNPYLESVQQRQGVYAFKVIMDATNNTPDVIDRNQMVGELFLQPAKAAEFIILDFNILPTGAAFPE